MHTTLHETNKSQRVAPQSLTNPHYVTWDEQALSKAFNLLMGSHRYTLNTTTALTPAALRWVDPVLKQQWGNTFCRVTVTNAFPEVKTIVKPDTFSSVLPIRVTGVPYSKAEMAVHFPVPFCPALSRILGSRCVPSLSLYLRMLAVISMRKESSSVLFQLSKA